MSNSKLQVAMIGSVPMSVNELHLAPAIISALIRQKGHNFQFHDINLDLYDMCGRSTEVWQEKVEILRNLESTQDDVIVNRWMASTLKKISQCDYLLVNVFSHFSQSVAFKIVKQVRQQYPHIYIMVGGIGSQKLINNDKTTKSHHWIRQNFADCSKRIFGALLLNNNLVDSWQSDASTSEIERVIPTRLVLDLSTKDFDFSIYNIDRYDWLFDKKKLPLISSSGCVRQCRFCDVINYFPAYSFIEADQLTKQIVEIYQQTGISNFSFVDSLINGSMKNFLAVLKNLAHSKQQGWLPKDFNWSGSYICRPRSTQLDQIHKLFSESGADTLVIGVETGSDRVRFEMDKKFTNADLLYELNACSQNRVKTTLLFFPAWPTETADDFKQTLELFSNLAKFAQDGTVRSVSLGTNGFSLIDGTAIDRDKEKIGLTSGPAEFLWKCAINPDLDFWEAIQRRLIMAEVAEYYGMYADNENMFLRYLLYILKTYLNTIIEYSGPVRQSILDHSSILSSLPNAHTLNFTVVNSGKYSVDVICTTDNSTKIVKCNPGLTTVEWQFDKNYLKDQHFKINFKFAETYQAEWDQWDSGDYYDVNGLYLDQIYLDHRDMTFYGWNQIVNQTVDQSVQLPVDWNNYVNQRCVSAGFIIDWTVPKHQSIQQYFLTATLQDEYQERQSIKDKIVQYLKDQN